MDLQHPSMYRIVGIDPGTNTLGVSLLGLDLDTQQLELIEAMTLTAEHRLHLYQQVAAVYGERQAKLRAHYDALCQYFRQVEPHAISSESPFMGRLPQAFAALTECVQTIRQATEAYDNQKPLSVYDPATVKKKVKVSGKSGDKEAMRRAVMGLTFIRPDQLPFLESADEHTIDAIAVAYCHYLHLVGAV